MTPDKPPILDYRTPPHVDDQETAAVHRNLVELLERGQPVRSRPHVVIPLLFLLGVLILGVIVSWVQDYLRNQ